MKILHPQIWKQQLRDALLYWVIIPAGVIVPGLLIDALFALPPLPGYLMLQTVAALLLAAGCFLIWKATVDLEKFGGGTPNPFRPARHLVTLGSYGFCRHPMFLGYDLAALGVVLLCRSPAMLLAGYPVFLALQIRFLKKEEHLLSLRFKKKYDEYQREVPLLLPFRFSRRK